MIHVSIEECKGVRCLAPLSTLI